MVSDIQQLWWTRTEFLVLILVLMEYGLGPLKEDIDEAERAVES